MMGKARILTVDSNPRNLSLLEGVLRGEGYEVVPAGDVEELDAVLEEGKSVSVALVDITGLDARVWERCATLQAIDVPVLVISGKRNASVERESAAAGARGVLQKPLVVKELLGIIQALVEG